MNGSIHRRRGLITSLALLICVSAAQAGGLYLTEIGTPTSNGTAGAANVTNDITADAVWTNPAGMAWIDRNHFVAGNQFLIPAIRWDSDVAEAGGGDGGNAGQVALIPSFFWMRPGTEKVHYGIGMSAPLGGGFDFGDDFAGRYIVEEIALQGLAVTPSMSVLLSDSVSLGIGASMLYTTFEMDVAINTGGPDGKVQIEDADDIGFQGHLGMQWKYSDNGTFGAIYRSKAEVSLDGDVTINLGAGPMPSSGITLDWDNPQLFEVGFRQKLSDRWMIMGNVDWEDWSEFSENIFTVDAGMSPAVLDRNWKDTYKFGFGAHRTQDNKHMAMGIAYDTSPVSDGNRTLDLPTDEQLRLSFYWGRMRPEKKLNFGFGGTALWMGKGKVDQTNQGVRVAGEFDTNWIFFVGGAAFYRFGKI